MRSCSVSDLQKCPQAIFDEVKSSKEPVFIGQNGVSSIAIVDADAYLMNMQALREFERIYRDTTPKKETVLAEASSGAGV